MGSAFQFLGEDQLLTVEATRVHESMGLDASFASGAVANPSNDLTTVRLWATYYRHRRIGGTLEYFSTTGSTDTGLYPAAAPGTAGTVTSANGSPETRGWAAEVNYLPWLNTKLSLQYTKYTKFNGGSANHDGVGRDASANDTLYLLLWFSYCGSIMRTFSTKRARCHPLAVLTGRLLIYLAGAVALSLPVTATFADEPDVVSAAYARRLAIGICGTCHGPHGNSTQPKFPRLAGQNANYLATQLKAFRTQTRGDPDALGYMWGMASQLDDSTIDALAKYYSMQKPESARNRNSDVTVRGRDIYRQGVESEGVPPCASCHGPDAHGLADFPRLAGQHGQYVLKQLGSFQSNMRNVAVMHGVAQNLRITEMESVAAYLETQP